MLRNEGLNKQAMITLTSQVSVKYPFCCPQLKKSDKLDRYFACEESRKVAVGEKSLKRSRITGK